MKIFKAMHLREAYAYSMAGGQALHVHRIVFKDSPSCFRRAVAQGEYIAHLFDQNELRLIATARRFGVGAMIIEHRGTEKQHVDLCGKPLKKAIEESINKVILSIEEDMPNES